MNLNGGAQRREDANRQSVEVLPFDEFNQALIENVRPPHWRNPTPAGRYNLVVIGAGAAGLVSAAGAAGLGAKVALVERHLLGGDCLNVGCVPSKALIASARAFAAVRNAHQFGIEVPPGARVNFAEVMSRMRRLRASISPADSADRFRKLGVDVFFGQANFVNRDSIQVEGQTLHFKRAVVAVGTRPAAPPIPKLDEVGFLTNETIFSLTELPKRLLVIGAGPIGCELAQAFARFGSEVTLIEVAPNILPNDDSRAAEVVARSLANDGVRILVGARATVCRRIADEKHVTVESPKGRIEIAGDEILVATGRKANVEELGLDAAGVQFDSSGVQVDERLRTTNSRIYAAGDICSKFKFTHAADAMARIVIQNALFMGRAKYNTTWLPWCTYTDPEVAQIGLTENEAQVQGLEASVFEHQFQDVDRAVLEGQTIGFVKILTKKGKNRILGATIVASHAGEMICELSVAMRGGLGLKEIGRAIHPYPTQSECIKKVADAYNRSRLTPWVRSLFERWLAWTR